MFKNILVALFFLQISLTSYAQNPLPKLPDEGGSDLEKPKFSNPKAADIYAKEKDLRERMIVARESICGIDPGPRLQMKAKIQAIEDDKKLSEEDKGKAKKVVHEDSKEEMKKQFKKFVTCRLEKPKLLEPIEILQFKILDFCNAFGWPKSGRSMSGEETRIKDDKIPDYVLSRWEEKLLSKECNNTIEEAEKTLPSIK